MGTTSGNLRSTVIPKLKPINELSEFEQAKLAEGAQIFRMRAGENKLLGEPYRLAYLLSGQLLLKSNDFEDESVEAGCQRAFSPLAVLYPSNLSVWAKSECIILSIDADLYDTYIKQRNSSNLNNLHRFQEQIQRACQNNLLDLPVMPEVAMLLRKLASEAEPSIHNFVQIVQQDIVIAARLVEVANSALYRPRVPILTVRDAAVRLGFFRSCQIASSLSLRSVFKFKHSQSQDLINELWLHSKETSAACYVLAKNCTELNPETALLAGLIHDVGVLPIILFNEQHGFELDSSQLRVFMGQLRSQIGSIVLKSWGINSELITAATEAENWARLNTGTVDFADLVIVAQLFSRHSYDSSHALPDVAETSVFHKVAMHFDAETGLDILVNAQLEIETICRFMSD